MGDFEDAVRLTKLAEDLGFDGLTFGDHVVVAPEPTSAYPGTSDGKPSFAPDTPWPDVWVLMGALAMVTTTVRFLTTVYLLPLRNPLVPAKAAGTASVIAGGRVEMGVGVGWQREEFDALEADFSTRGARTDEAITLLRKLWEKGPTEHHGRFYHFGPMLMEPVPAEPLPIYVGGNSQAAWRRAARLGDGYISMPTTLDGLAELIPRVRSLATEAEDAGERGHGRFLIFANCNHASTADDFQRMADLGADVALVRPVNLGVTSGDSSVADGMKRFANQVIALVKERL